MSEVLRHTFVQWAVVFPCALPPLQTVNKHKSSLAVNSAAVGSVGQVNIMRGTTRAVMEVPEVSCRI